MRMAAGLATCFALATAALATGCAAGEPVVKLKGESYTVEIADDMAERARGLMFRREMAADRGMLFVYPSAEPQAFWMKNCFIPLDILFFDADARFINGHYGVPICSADPCPSYPAERPARYVLELNANVGKALGLEPGDLLSVPKLPAAQ